MPKHSYQQDLIAEAINFKDLNLGGGGDEVKKKIEQARKSNFQIGVTNDQFMQTSNKVAFRELNDFDCSLNDRDSNFGDIENIKQKP